jgi:hypothetical protein
MKKLSKYNDPVNYSNIACDFGFGEEKVPDQAVYAAYEEEEVIATLLPYNGRPVEDIMAMFDAVDLAMIEEIGRSKCLSSLQIYQFVTLRGLSVKRKGIRKRLNKMMKNHLVREYEIRLTDATKGVRCYELDYKGALIAKHMGVKFHMGNRYMDEQEKAELGFYNTAEDMKRILVGNMIVLGLLMNQASIERFGILETMRPVSDTPITDGCILRTVANVQIDEDSLLLYEVVRSTPNAMGPLENKMKRYYKLLNSEAYQNSNYYGYSALPQMVICGENYEHNQQINQYLRSRGLYSEKDSVLYTEDLLYVQSTLQNLYELDEEGNRTWYCLPAKQTREMVIA